jgi:hypothetical protein
LHSDPYKRAKSLLGNPRLKSLLVEIDDRKFGFLDEVLGIPEDGGFELVEKRRSPMFDGAEYSGFYNHSFQRSGDVGGMF